MAKSPPQCKLIRRLALLPGATCYCRRRKMSVILSEAKNLETDSAVTYRTCEALRFAEGDTQCRMAAASSCARHCFTCRKDREVRARDDSSAGSKRRTRRAAASQSWSPQQARRACDATTTG